ncbi:MAG: tail fiber domain-containing protein [Bacteroidia bacterium]|nr:tail fiber domain-containing protein [Bacteroidia bacterium]
MKNFTVLLIALTTLSLSYSQTPTLWKISENPVYYATTFESDGGNLMAMELDSDEDANKDLIRVFQNEDASVTVDMVISRSGEMNHSFRKSDTYTGDEPTAKWAYGNIDDYESLSYESSWKNMHDSGDINKKFDTQPNAVIHVMPYDIYIEYRLIAYHRGDNKAVDENDQNSYFNFYSNSNLRTHFAHLRGGPGGETSSDTFTFHTSENTKYWPLDNVGFDNIRIVKNSSDDPNTPFNHDAIADGIQISRLNSLRDDSDNGLKNILDPDFENALLGGSGKMLMFARVPYDFNLETELKYIPDWHWKHNLISLYHRMLKNIGNRQFGNRFKTLVAVVNHSYENETDSYETELIAEMQILKWGAANDDGEYNFEYVRGSGSGDTELGSNDSGVHYADTTSGSGGLLKYNTDSGFQGYRLDQSMNFPDNYGTLGKNAVDLSMNSVNGNQGAIADFALASGINTTADGYNSTVIGSFNTSDLNADADSFSLSNRAFVIGNGDETTRSDAMTVLFDGTTTISGELNVNSDMRLKTNIMSLGATLLNVLQIDGKSYKIKRDASQETKIGLLAQDIQKIYPELVSEQNGILSVNYQGLVPVLINAIKEQQTLIYQNSKLIKTLIEKQCE